MKSNKHSTQWMVGLAMMAAIEIVLTATGIGLIPLPIIAATTLHIPVIVGAVILGPVAGAILGGVFGLCSMWNATINPTLLSFAFSPIWGTAQSGPIGAVKAIWIALGCRILIGLVSGLLWLILKKFMMRDLIALPVVGIVGALTNTILVMGSIFFLLAPEYAAARNVAMEAVLGLVLGTVATSGVAEAIAAAILVTGIGKPLLHTPLGVTRARMQASEK